MPKENDIFVDFESIDEQMEEEKKASQPDYVHMDETAEETEERTQEESAVRKKEEYKEDKKTKDIFGEEFNQVDVVNKNVVKVQHAEDNEKIIELDKMDLIQFYEERYKKESFEYQFVEMKQDKLDNIDELLRENFKDFLVYKKLAGNLSGLTHANRIPQERIRTSQKSVEVKDEKDDKHETKQIITHRNKFDEVDFIEVICNCGETTVIRFDYDDTADYEEEDKKNLYVEEKEHVDPIHNEAEDVFDDLGLADSIEDIDEEDLQSDGFTDLGDSVNDLDEMGSVSEAVETEEVEEEIDVAEEAMFDEDLLSDNSEIETEVVEEENDVAEEAMFDEDLLSDNSEVETEEVKEEIDVTEEAMFDEDLLSDITEEETKEED